jgi:hypothetical protein
VHAGQVVTLGLENLVPVTFQQVPDFGGSVSSADPSADVGGSWAR